ncbi:phosphopantetheine-binding protein [Streptomyces sp. AC550_RSS872]|uniref:phosphopantetheine-binding protein n=1 Tax=Streptomyces sp. AC550_RSS872 TaxID=2823689 RepID=UPI001C26C33D|nr:phosphopantetheine-binding protein [Streptomyces sp. AC550_RSS872]
MIPPWDHRFEDLMRAALRLLEPDEPLLPDMRTADYGLDSLAMVQLMLGIEETYGISIPDDVVEPGLFATPEMLWNTVAELLGSDSSSMA